MPLGGWSRGVRTDSMALASLPEDNSSSVGRKGLIWWDNPEKTKERASIEDHGLEFQVRKVQERVISDDEFI